LFSCCFFQAEAGIRDFHVTGVQTCALPISEVHGQEIEEERTLRLGLQRDQLSTQVGTGALMNELEVGRLPAETGTIVDELQVKQIGRASCRGTRGAAACGRTVQANPRERER